MIGVVNPIDHPEQWEFMTLQGVNTPGTVEVTGFKRSVEWDVKGGKGTAGATETVKGLPPAKGSAKFFAWRSSDFAAWDVLLPKLLYDPTKKTKQANAVYYPSLADIGVNSVNIEDIGAWEHEGGGMYTRTLELLEFAPAAQASAVATPTGANSASATTPGAPQDPAIVALQKEAAAYTKDAQRAYTL